MNNIMMRDPLNAQNFRTQRAESPEDLWQPLYDRVNVASASGSVASQLSFFSTPKGQSATLITGTSAPASKTKTYRDTNMDNAGVVPTKMFKFVGISLAFVHQTRQSTTNPADRTLLLDGGYLHFRVVDKDLLYLPLFSIPVLDPISGISTTANSTTMFATNPGGGAGMAMYKLPIPITINPYENFTVDMNFDGTLTFTGGLDIYVILQGFMRRPS